MKVSSSTQRAENGYNLIFLLSDGTGPLISVFFCEIRDGWSFLWAEHGMLAVNNDSGHDEEGRKDRVWRRRGCRNQAMRGKDYVPSLSLIGTILSLNPFHFLS